MTDPHVIDLRRLLASRIGPGASFRAALGNERLWHVMSCVLIVGLLGVMLATFLDYGITVDEGVQNRYSRRLVRWYASLGADSAAAYQNDLYLYGGLFEVTAAIAERVSPFGLYDTRHLVNVLYGLVAFVAAWGIGLHLGGPLAGFLSALFLALTPSFYGQAFSNPKDIPFASLFVLAAWVVLRVGERLPRLGWREVLLSGAVIGLAAGVRVAGIVLFGYAAVLWLGRLWVKAQEASAVTERPGWGEVASTCFGLLAVIAVGWAIMVALWPWAQIDPIRNPFRAFQKFSQFKNATILYDGQLVTCSEVSRYSIPKLLALTLPEFHLLAYLVGGLGILAALRSGRRQPDTAWRLFRALWVAALAGLPIAWVVLRRTPLYNSYRHLLFVVPFLAVLAGTSAAAFFRRWDGLTSRVAAAVGLSASLLLTAVDMIQLHPYQYVYFNRLFAGGLPRAVDRYETDYWCATYKEGIEWMVRHYSRPGLQEKIRVTGSTHVPFWYYLSRTQDGRRLFNAVTIQEKPHLVFATTALRDQYRTPGRVVHVVERQGAPLLYIFEVRTPR
jgi:hypothetical protein